VDHDRTVALVVLADVFHPEAFGEGEVALHRRELPEPTDRVVEVEIDLGTVERALPLRLAVRQPAALQRHRQRFRGLRRHLLVDDGLTGKGRQLDHGLVESERREDLERQIEHLKDLVDELIGTTDDVRVVLGTAADAE
jgi:hypothetical protein